MSYANPADIKKRYDVRRLGQLVKDDGSQASSAALDSDANLQAALDDATGEIDSSILTGGRYLPVDITTLLAGGGPPAAFLIRLCCDLAYGYLVMRRGFSGADLAAQAPSYARAVAVVKRLHEGDQVLNIQSALDAGKPRRTVLSKNRQLISGTVRHFGDLTVRPNNPGDALLVD